MKDKIGTRGTKLWNPENNDIVLGIFESDGSFTIKYHHSISKNTLGHTTYSLGFNITQRDKSRDLLDGVKQYLGVTTEVVEKPRKSLGLTKYSAYLDFNVKDQGGTRFLELLKARPRLCPEKAKDYAIFQVLLSLNDTKPSRNKPPDYIAVLKRYLPDEAIRNSVVASLAFFFIRLTKAGTFNKFEHVSKLQCLPQDEKSVARLKKANQSITVLERKLSNKPKWLEDLDLNPEKEKNILHAFLNRINSGVSESDAVEGLRLGRLLFKATVRPAILTKSNFEVIAKELSLEYLIGYHIGDGGFSIEFKNELGYHFRWAINDDIRNRALLRAIRHCFFETAIVTHEKSNGFKRVTGKLIITSAHTLKQEVLPLLKSYPMPKVRQRQIEMFEEALDIVSSKQHLTDRKIMLYMIDLKYGLNCAAGPLADFSGSPTNSITRDKHEKAREATISKRSTLFNKRTCSFE